MNIQILKKGLLILVLGLLGIFTGDSQAAYTDNGDGTVTDSITGLVWQQVDDGVTRTWEEALTHCEDMALGDKTDWRLPNVLELQSLVDYSRYNPTIDPIYQCRSAAYWSSSTVVSSIPHTHAWIVGFAGGHWGAVMKTDNRIFARCVRGWQ